MLLRSGVTFALAAAALAATPTQAAAVTTQAGIAAESQDDGEGRRTAYQIAAGVGVSVVGNVGAGLLLIDPNDQELELKHVALIGAVVTTTALTGWVSCLVGRTSPRYTGYCNGAMAGAFVGVLPLALGTGACMLAGAHEACYVAAIATLSIMPSLGAAIGWNAMKRPRPVEQPQALTLRAEEPFNARARYAAGARTLAVPLLAWRF
jgi:hypothetical protein